VDTLLKNVGAASSRPKALQELVQRLTAGEADTDILLRTDDFVKLLCPMVKNAFDKNTSTLAMEALAVFGKSNAGVVDWFVNEIQKGSASSALLAVRGIGKVGAPAKEKAVPVLTAILTNPQTKTSNAALYNEALMARASLGAPFEKEIIPEMVKVMSSLKEPRQQFEMALFMIQDPELLKTYSVQLEPVIVKFLQARPLPLESEAYWASVEAFLFAAVKMDTPNSRKVVTDLLDKPFGQWEMRKRMAVAFRVVDTPPTYVVMALLKYLEKEKFHGAIVQILETLTRYGSEDSLPFLRKYLQDAKRRNDFMRGEEFKFDILNQTESAIKRIEKAVAEKEKGGGAKAETPKEP